MAPNGTYNPLAPALAYSGRRRTGDPRDHDPGRDVAGLPPNLGQQVLPHVVTFQGILRNVAKVYQASDESVRDSLENARFMRNDTGIMECLEQRQRSTALLDWKLAPDDENDPEQLALCDELTRILKATPRFMQYRECLLEALWYGKYAIQNRYRWKFLRGKRRLVVDHWEPINGDKLVFRFDDGSAEWNPDQIGIRVGAGMFLGDRVRGRWVVEREGKLQATEHGLAYFLENWERDLLTVHKHRIEDGEYESPERAGRIHGVGIRDRIYWLWYQKQESMAWLMEYLERSAFGIEIWSYPAANPEAEKKTRKAAEERIGNGRNVVLVPRFPESEMLSTDVKRIEPGMAGVDALDRILREYFGHQIKRYILGQILTSETASTGLGSGVASIHLDTYLQIVKYDATNLEETVTRELLDPLKRFNFPQHANTPIYFKILTESPDIEGKLKAWHQAWEMGLGLKAEEVGNLIGATKPAKGDEVLQSPQAAQAQQMAQQQAAGNQVQGWSPGQERQHLNEPEGPQETARMLQQILQGQKQQEDYARRMDRRLERLERRRERRERYAKSEEHHVGDTKVVNSRIYRLNPNSRWERVGKNTDPEPTIHVTGTELGLPLDTKEDRKAALVALKRLYQGRQFTNKHSGKAIDISAGGIKEVLHHLPDKESVWALAKLPELLEESDYIGWLPPEENDDRNIRAFHYLGIDLTIAGRKHYAIITVSEHANQHWFYDERSQVLLTGEGPSVKPGAAPEGTTLPADGPSTGSIDPPPPEVKRNRRSADELPERYRRDAAGHNHQPSGRSDGGQFAENGGAEGAPENTEAPADALARGIAQESEEHGADIAERVARDHLEEDPGYYDQPEEEPDEPPADAAAEARKFDPKHRQYAPVKATHAAGLARLLKHPTGKLHDLAIRDGLATDSRFVMVLPEKDQKHFAEKVAPTNVPAPARLDPKIVRSYFEHVHDEQPATIRGARRLDAPSGPYTEILLQAPSGKQAVVDGFYHHLILSRYPQATMHVPAGMGHVVHYKVDGQTIGVVPAKDIAESDRAVRKGEPDPTYAQPKRQDDNPGLLATLDDPAASRTGDFAREYGSAQWRPPARPQRKVGINPKTQAGQAILAAAREYGVPPDDLADAAQFVLEGKQEVIREREEAKKWARKVMHLNVGRIGMIENAGHDLTYMKHLDASAQEFISEHPMLGLDDSDPARSVWDFIHEGAQRVPQVYDEEILREAARLLEIAAKGRGQQQPEEEMVPFARQGLVERYRQWQAERSGMLDTRELFALAFARRGWPERYAAAWDEEKHPRGKGGKFSGKSLGEARFHDEEGGGGGSFENTPPLPRVEYRDAPPREFLDARNRSDRPQFLSPKDEESLQGVLDQGGMARLSADGTSGYVLTHDGDLRSVFNNGGPRGAGMAAVIDAIARGAKTLDCIGDGLAVRYSRAGFVARRAERWSDEHAPEGWDYQRDGRPDIFFMAYEGGSRDPEQLRKAYGTYPKFKHPGYQGAGATGVGSGEGEES